MSAGKNIKMISIDDKTLTTDLDRAGYRKMGVYVRPAANFEEAMRLFKGEEIDLVVINMDYKQVDACQVARHLKASELYGKVPVVLTSVQTSAKVRNSALDAGADLFVEQPLPRQYFIEKLKQMLEHRTRTTERVNVHGEVKYRVKDEEFSCPVGDLSISGMLLSTDQILDAGVEVSLEFELPGNKKPIKAEGVVVRVIAANPKHPERHSGIGIRFEKFLGDSQKRLEKYVEKMAGGDEQMAYYL